MSRRIRPPGVLFAGGPILTMAEPHRVEAVAIADERIVHAGSLADCRLALGRDRHEIDLGGRALLPGFVDAHAHPLMAGQTSSWVDAGPDAAGSIDELVALLARHARILPPGRPVLAFGYDHRRLAERRHPTAADLDRVATDREVYLMNGSGHGGVVNSFALAGHGITAATPDLPGGELGRHPDGSPNGFLMDAACDLLTGPDGVKIGNHGPNFHLPATPAETAAALDRAMEAFLRAGVTTVLDAQVSRREMEAWIEARDAGRLRLRTNMLVISSLLDDVLELGLTGRLGDDILAFSGIKLYADGTLGGWTAWFPEGYAGEPDNHGLLYHEPAEYRELVRRAHSAGLQTGTHAQSPAAIEIVLDALEAAQHERPRPDLRHAIEHCGLPTDDQIARMARLGIVAVAQPQHHRSYGDNVRAAVGEEMGGRYNPLGLFEASGVRFALSSDAPVNPPQPLLAVQAAVERRTVSGARLGGPELRLSVASALEGITIGGAYAIHREQSIGSLEPGKLADLAILAADPTGVANEAIGSITVEETWLGGVRVT